MKFVDLLAMSLKNLSRRKLRTALTVLGVVIGTASIVVMVSLGIGLSELNRELISSYGSLTEITVNNPYNGDSTKDPLYLTDDVVKQMEKLPYVTGVYPMLQVDVLMQQGKYTSNVTLNGVPYEYLKKIPLGQGTLSYSSDHELKLIYGNAIIQWFTDAKGNNTYWETGELPNVDFMGKPMFVIFDTDTYYQSQNGGEDAPKPPKKYLLKADGVVEGGVDDYNSYAYNVYTRLDLLETQLKRIFKKKAIPGQPTTKKGKPYRYFIYNSCSVNVDDIEHVGEVQKKLTDMGFQASSNADWMKQSEQQSNMIQAVLGGIGAVSLFVAAIGIANTMMMSIYERTKEIGIIKVLGCDMKVIRNMFLLESGFIGFMGGVVGLVFSAGISFAINHLLQIGQTMTGMSGNISRIPLWLAAASVGFAVLMGMAAGFFPALRAMKLSPLAAIRNE
ncbi:FtsX-like permease family protein [Clostridium sp. AF32-12BH]|uniref:ABC transporter permease n=1 Tax=Clostridium sp. AF32-12BH TaxID=2292006 RepID=UPI000E4B278F|nr:FtsX-like permease family protein [Clostridium sp. AF32-12BH]RHP45627.1 ABC transporter permease [Clostridium sp. AF32-12BH]